MSDNEAGAEGGAATFKTHNYTTEIALQLDDGTSEVFRNSAVERGGTNEVKNELKGGYECNEVKNELKDGYTIGSQRNAIEMHEKRKGDQAMWLNTVCGTRVLWLEPKDDERDLSRMSDKKHLGNGRFSVSAKTQDSGLWRRTPRLTLRPLDSAQVKRFTTTKSRVRQPGGQSLFIPAAYAARRQAKVQILSSIVARQMK